MTRNRSTDLNNLLFEQLERINEASAEEIDLEINRSKSMATLANSIIDNARLSLDAQKFIAEYGGNVNVPEMLIEHKK